MKIGSHVSISGGLLGAAKEAYSYGANTFMVYTGAPQNTVRKPMSELKIPEGKAFMAEHGLSDIVVHAPYIINLASYKSNIFDLAKSFLKQELERTSEIGSDYLVLHPGAFTDKDLNYGIDRICEGINSVLDESHPDICLETMSGKGSEIGRNPQELAMIMDKIILKEKIKVCLDTCHIHDAGYDIVNALDDVLKEFDSALGLDNVKVVHVNGSLNERGAKKDRHANIGAGSDNPKGSDKIGLEAIRRLMRHERLKNKIFILETPWLDEKTNLYKEEIAALLKNE